MRADGALRMRPGKLKLVSRLNLLIIDTFVFTVATSNFHQLNNAHV